MVPVEGFYEPDWRSGRAVPTLLRAADVQPLSLAGLWSSWQAEDGQTIHSFTMLTINAEQHLLMRQFHKPTDEKRMVVVLSAEGEQSWLQDLDRPIVDFMRPCADGMLEAAPTEAPRQGKLV